MQRRLKAGREYLAALRKLGFVPDALLWAGVGKAAGDAEMELLIVTSWVDSVGSRSIYDVLFEAYDASATPKEIDPFVVSLFSPHTQVAADIRGGMEAVEAERFREGVPMLVLGMLDYFTIPDWVIQFRRSKTNVFDDARRFRAFQNNVAKLAA
jgi:hypothetical protein